MILATRSAFMNWSEVVPRYAMSLSVITVTLAGFVILKSRSRV